MSSTFFPYIGSTLTLQPMNFTTWEATRTSLPNDTIVYAQTLSSASSYRIVSTNGTSTGINTRPSRVSPNVQTFTSNGTWVRPAAGRITQFMLWGGGGGGGSATGVTSGARGGGGGGGPGSVITQCFCLTQLLPSTATITVGSGGAGGTAAVGTGVGTPGTSGGATSVGFGAPIGLTVFRVRGGTAGGGASASVGNSNNSCFSDLPGGFNASVTNSGTLQTPGPGGAGQSSSSAGFPSGPSSGTSVGTGSLSIPIAGGSTAAAAGAAGTVSGRIGFGGAGGSGGGGPQSTLQGGTGGFPGGGGGGSGYRSSSQTSRAGGTGGGGYVIAITW
jgi:hypothetical protein